jgi:hypothetical protein
MIITFRKCNKNSPVIKHILENVAVLAECSHYTLYRRNTLLTFWSSCPEIVEMSRRTLFLSFSGVCGVNALNDMFRIYRTPNNTEHRR